jgi:hypothetical protein
MVANMVGLPILLATYGVGSFLLMGIAIASDGGSVPSIWYVFTFFISAVSGALIGACLGFIQSLPLKMRISQSGKWIAATSLGVAVGAPLSWLVFIWMLESPFFNRLSGLLFFFLYQDISFGALLGLSVGVAQWFVLKQHIRRAGLWVIALPILYTGGLAFSKGGFVYIEFIRAVHRQLQAITRQSLEINTPALGMYLLFGITPFLALGGISFLSGVILERLFQGKQNEGQ